jgi:steroid 5-alpha reductase family enzyme
MGGGAMQSSMLGAALVDFGIQLVGWAAAATLRTEKFYDILGSAAFATTAALTLGTSAMMPRKKLASALAMAWTARLGIFLGARAHRDGGDSRFDGVKDKPGVFAVYWFLQGVWVWVTSLPVYLLNGSPGQLVDLNAVDWTLAAFWAFGFVFEVVADVQKFAFKSDKSNKGKYIKHGLWSLSRHPNYFGEICMWFGVAGIACNGLAASNPGRAAGAFASPLFVTYLLTKMSGIPILERMADERWGKDEGYQSYKRKTPVLVPKLPGT